MVLTIDSLTAVLYDRATAITLVVLGTVAILVSLYRASRLVSRNNRPTVSVENDKQVLFTESAPERDMAFVTHPTYRVDSFEGAFVLPVISHELDCLDDDMAHLSYRVLYEKKELLAAAPARPHSAVTDDTATLGIDSTAWSLRELIPPIYSHSRFRFSPSYRKVSKSVEP